MEEEEVSTTSYSNLSNTAHQYHLVQGENAIKSLISFLDRQDAFCFDTETTSLVAIEAQLVGMSFSYRKGEAFTTGLGIQATNTCTRCISTSIGPPRCRCA